MSDATPIQAEGIFSVIHLSRLNHYNPAPLSRLTVSMNHNLNPASPPLSSQVQLYIPFMTRKVRLHVNDVWRIIMVYFISGFDICEHYLVHRTIADIVVPCISRSPIRDRVAL